VVSGQFLVDSEANLRASTARMGETAAQAAEQGANATHRGEGKVESIGKEEITISHGPIASLQWGPMTMGFKLPATGLPQGIAAGNRVNFDFRQTKDGTFQITSIAPVQAGGATSADAAAKGVITQPRDTRVPGSKP
jgi:Cu(I)/Ag(I) efflux system membrane fusion protein